jgi:hypothetical protein
MYVALVGPPGVKKSTAINIMRARLKNSTNVRFAPDDTGGQRQGLIMAMIEDEENEEIKKIINDIENASVASLEAIAGYDMSKLPDDRDKFTLFICASELNSVLGNDVLTMLPFLNKMYDGEAYDYRLKGSRHTLEDTHLYLLGATTPQNIATAFPSEAIGQGFMSRLLFVFGNKKYKSIPRPLPFNKKLEKAIEDVFYRLGHAFEGEFIETKQAFDLLTMVYEEKPKIEDPRFVYYAERRHMHLVKLAMLMCAGRLSHSITLDDVEEARAILQAAETSMPDALGEYGMSKLSAAKQKLVEFLRNAKQPVSTQVLYAMMARDMGQADFRNSLAELCNAGKIMEVKTGAGMAYVYRDPVNEEVDEILGLLEDKTEEEVRTGTGED